MTKDHEAARHDRLRNALRENLKRRKAQAKGRAAATDLPADDAPNGHDESANPVRPAGTKPAS
jgi:hypothetical protein